ncbi:beta-galactosidase [Fictibacillus phosphorivorans]|uniref:beta-galactosidase n=1 Tax=Fictibacillus phosphorivorans TaxID=1221500 RepID=UPI00203A3F93|nr:beta-galactosidase [Fictibacillus phosphorivorans]MCM3720211.1 beta-galactosidase [Fictibacillus phosphorivorans]MCM3777902.1 beta-galactosidase [Fictibacillus phosphorivorans]
MIQIKNEKVIVDGKEIMLFGGELHYFRVPRDEWRTRILQVKEAGANMVSTYVPWIFHEYEEGSIDLTGETRPERDLKTFLQLVKEEGMYCLVRPGPYVMAEIVDHGVPTWFIDHYPEAVAKTNDGKQHPTRVVSYSHPVFLEKVEIWYEKVCAVIRPFLVTNGGSVILFQLDNEVGMFHWVTNQPDYNESTLTEFTEHLKHKYTQEEFQQTFCVPYSELKSFAESKSKKPEPIFAHALRNEFGLFLREHYRRFIEYLKRSAEDKGIDVPFVVNIHGFHTIDLTKRGTMYPIGISQLLETAKIDNVLMAGDYYIGNIEYDNYTDIVLANAFTKAVQWKEQPLFSAEFQGGSIHDKPRLQPATFDLTTRLCIADGMNGVNYYMFAAGENYENIGLFGKRHDWQAPLTKDGKKSPHYYTIQHIGKMLQVFEGSLIETKPEVDTHFGFYPDYYMTEFHDEHTKDMTDQIQHKRDAYLYNGIAKALRVNNIVYDAVNLLDDDELDPRKLPTLWMFSTEWMDENIQQKLVNYMENGGKLILFPTVPVKTMKNVPCTILKDYIGVAVKGHKHHGFVQIDETENVITNQLEIYETESGAFAWTEDEKEVVAFEKKLGKGTLIMFGIGMDHSFNYQNDLIVQLAERAGIKSRFQLDEELDLTVRTSPDHGSYLFIQNFDEYKKKTTLHYKGKPLFDGKELTVPQRAGLMLPIDVPLRDDLSITYGTGEIYHLKQEQNKLELFIKIEQNEEEFVFHSSDWIPSENEAITVQKLTEHQFKVLIRSHNETERILFNPVAVQASPL